MKKSLFAWVGLGWLAAAAAVFAGEAAPPDFTLPDLQGKPFHLQDVLGKRVVVINFWAAWCTSCKEEIPQLAAFQASAPDPDTLFLGVNVGENDKKAKRFQTKSKYPYTVLLDQDKSIAKAYAVVGIPQTLVISLDQKIVFRGSRPPKSWAEVSTPGQPSPEVKP
jgi:peroxiredoxin